MGLSDLILLIALIIVFCKYRDAKHIIKLKDATITTKNETIKTLEDTISIKDDSLKTLREMLKL